VAGTLDGIFAEQNQGRKAQFPWEPLHKENMNTISSYIKGSDGSHPEQNQGGAYHHLRAQRHQQEAERLYLRGDDRQAALHASISNRHAARATELDKESVAP
jgi:hypothetical protein